MGRGQDFDDNGLPPTDVVIPDDARELDREMQAYHRELRWRRRRELWRKIFGRARKPGTATPLLAGILILAALCAVLLVLSSRPDGEDFQPLPRTAPDAGRHGAIGAPIIDVRATVDGRPRHLSSLHPAVLALVPPGCDCGGALNSMTAATRRYGIPVYLVESGPEAPELDQLASHLGDQQRPSVLEDPEGKIARAYGGPGLDAVLVNGDGQVSTVLDTRALRSEQKLEKHLAPLRGSWASNDDGQGPADRPGS